jgi:hypothetical protein
MTSTITAASPRLRSPGIGIGWMLWRQHRLWMTALMLYLAVLSVLAHEGLAARIDALWATLLFAPLMCGGFGILCAFVALDVRSSASGVPAYLLVLPVKSRTFVGWTFLYGVTIAAAAWICLDVGVLIPINTHAHSTWDRVVADGLGRAAQMAVAMAVAWYPVGRSRGGLAIGAMLLAWAGIVIGEQVALSFRIAPWEISATHLAIIGCC